jgi:small subunit ribosomal protein S21
MIGIKIRDNENIDRAINRFKKLITRSRMMIDFKERQQYIKPSEARRESMKKSVRDERRRLREDY